MGRVLITGAAGGIGCELARRYRAAGDEVIATCREPSDSLRTLGCEVLAGIDLTRQADLDRVAATVAGRRLDILVHNAGLLRADGYGELRASAAAMRAQFEVNALAPLLLTETLDASLGAGSKLALITSRMGSVGDNSSGGYYGYRMSKAALNSAGRSLAINLRERGIAVALLHPGFVRTPMTAGAGDLDPAESARLLVQRIAALSLASSGQFWHARGEELPW